MRNLNARLIVASTSQTPACISFNPWARSCGPLSGLRLITNDTGQLACGGVGSRRAGRRSWAHLIGAGVLDPKNRFQLPVAPTTKKNFNVTTVARFLWHYPVEVAKPRAANC